MVAYRGTPVSIDMQVHGDTVQQRLWCGRLLADVLDEACEGLAHQVIGGVFRGATGDKELPEARGFLVIESPKGPLVMFVAITFYERSGVEHVS